MKAYKTDGPLCGLMQCACVGDVEHIVAKTVILIASCKLGSDPCYRAKICVVSLLNV